MAAMQVLAGMKAPRSIRSNYPLIPIWGDFSARFAWFLRISPLWVALIAIDGMHSARAEQRTANIVGLGATTCQRFSDEVKTDPPLRRDYLAWAQGFMSGILLSRPPGVDVGLDLNPSTFGLMRQLEFLEDYCARNTSADFAGAVEGLYKRLRQEGRT
jgi:hypothetical protein